MFVFEENVSTNIRLVTHPMKQKHVRIHILYDGEGWAEV